MLGVVVHFLTYTIEFLRHNLSVTIGVVHVGVVWVLNVDIHAKCRGRTLEWIGKWLLDVSITIRVDAAVQHTGTIYINRFLNGFYEMIRMFLSHIFDIKTINYQCKHDWLSFILP